MAFFLPESNDLLEHPEALVIGSSGFPAAASSGDLVAPFDRAKFMSSGDSGEANWAKRTVTTSEPGKHENSEPPGPEALCCAGLAAFPMPTPKPSGDTVWDPNRLLEFEVLWFSDVPLEALARYYGRCGRTVQRWRADLGLQPRRALRSLGLGAKARLRLRDEAFPGLSQEARALIARAPIDPSAMTA